MRNFPILFMHLFGPTPETTLPDGRRLICRKILVQVKTIGANLVNDESHLVLVMRNRCASVDLRCQVSRSNFGLPHGHVAHLRPVEVCAIANCINPLAAGDTHGGIDVDITFVVGDTEI